MVRRNKHRDDFAIVLIASVPWWGWILLAGGVLIFARALTKTEIPGSATPAQFMIGPLIRVSGLIHSIFGPVIGVLLAVISALARRKFAAAALSSSIKSREIDPLSSIDTTTLNLPLIKALEWKRLEDLGAIYFRTLNFRVEEADHGPDGGVDLRLFVGSGLMPGILVQCKAWNSWKIGVKEIRELFGVMTKEGVNEGIFLTTSTFTDDAIAFARGTNIALIEGTELLQKLRDLPAENQAHILKSITSGDFIAPTCPSCGIKMVKRVARDGGDPFWGCARYPGCRRTFPISSS